jgi:HAMP domain-containing protein
MKMWEKDQADLDLERCFNLFDQALTSNDERVVDSLRNLMMVVALVAPEMPRPRLGPLRRMREEIESMNRAISQLANEIREIKWREEERAIFSNNVHHTGI